MPIPITDCWPPYWKGLLDPLHPQIGIGFDVATTAKKKSNPSCLCVTQKVGTIYRNVAAVAWKSEDPSVALGLIEEALTLPHGLKVRRLCIDATSERYFAQNVKKSLSGRVTTQLVISSESLEYMGEQMSWKHYTGNRLVNLFVDSQIEIPNEEWCKKMIRQVYTEGGSFASDVDEQGNHADYFDGLKLSIEAAGSEISGPAQATAAGTGHTTKAARSGLKNPLLRRIHQKIRWS